ncbi:hypothetical protein HY486_02370 [Candidatus Woesearchaeota archaeon]|nr:hypothetical protein [Candidatus Woesearchaeota archaeon]
MGFSEKTEKQDLLELMIDKAPEEIQEEISIALEQILAEENITQTTTSEIPPEIEEMYAETPKNMQDYAKTENTELNYIYEAKTIFEGQRQQDSYEVVIEQKAEQEQINASVSHAFGLQPEKKAQTLIEQEHLTIHKILNRFWMFVIYELAGL